MLNLYLSSAERSKKNLIKISVKKEGMYEDELPELALVWLDDADKVKEIHFNEDGMSRLFNAGDLLGEEFAQALVTNYPGIPRLKRDVNESVIQFTHANVKRTMAIRTTTYMHRDPKGYQVKCFERVVIDDTGKVYNSVKKTAWDYVLDYDSKPKKFFAITAIKPESSRKFD